MSAGTSQTDVVKLAQIVKAVPAIDYICLDVANGYSELFVQHVKTVREMFPEHTIMVSIVLLF